jgi:hypothetical protein
MLLGSFPAYVIGDVVSAILNNVIGMRRSWQKKLTSSWRVFLSKEGIKGRE